jgi:hypothetical protein
MPMCINRQLPSFARETRAQRYRRLALAETDPARAKILWRLVEDAQRNALCTADGADLRILDDAGEIVPIIEDETADMS